jgi:hypothetical protein
MDNVYSPVYNVKWSNAQLFACVSGLSSGTVTPLCSKIEDRACLISSSKVQYDEDMNFEWDENKNETNIAKHGLDFADAPRIFKLPLRISLDEREDYGEDRWIGLGMLDGRVVVVIYTELNDQTIRILSLRKALPHERKRYEQYLKDELGAG